MFAFYFAPFELEEERDVLLRKEELLAEIEELGAHAIAMFGDRPRRYIKVYPRYKMHFPWRGEKVGMWRLEQCIQPLWLGEDNAIHRGEGSMAGSDRPDYCEVAEIERRQVGGLERVRDALLFEIDSFMDKLSGCSLLRNGAEI